MKIRKRLSLFVIFCLLIMQCIMGTNFVVYGTDIPEMTGDGSSGSPFKITDGAQFKLIGTGSYLKTLTYQVMNAITIPNDYTPITEFAGTLFSEGSCGMVTVNITGTDNVGLFSTVTTCTIRNITILGSVSGTGNVGGLIGSTTNSGTVQIFDCVNEAAITGTGANIGGVVGYFQHPNSYDKTVLTNCGNEGTINGGASGTNVGGVVGYLFSGLTVMDNCYNTGNVSGTTPVGGIVGLVNSGTIKNSINTGAVTGSDGAGGIAGNAGGGKILNSYNTGHINTTTQFSGGIAGKLGAGLIEKSYNGGYVESAAHTAGILGQMTAVGAVKNCYNAGDVHAKGSGSSGGICASLYGAGTITRVYNVGKITSVTAGNAGGIYTKLNSGNENNISCAFYLSATETDAIAGTTAKDLDPMKAIAELLNADLEGGEEAFEDSQNINYPFPEIIGLPYAGANYVPAMEGDGIQATPFLITSGDHFNLIGTGSYLLTSTYKLINDITVPDNYVPVAEFAGKLFADTLKTITVNINMPEADDVGLFATTRDCTIENIRIDGSVTGKGRVGGLIGRAGIGVKKINIINCVNNASITGTSADAIGLNPGIGGLIGIVGPHTDGYQSAITNSGNTGTVTNTAGQCVGGVVGNLNGGGSVMDGCYNLGQVQGYAWVGGIAGAINTGTIKNSYNKGEIKTNSTAGAGICGFINSGTVAASYNGGNVQSSGNAGGIAAGIGNVSGKITGCYNTGDIYAGGAGYAGGICANLTAGGSAPGIERSYNVGAITSATDGRTGGIYGGTTTVPQSMISKNYYLSADEAHNDGIDGSIPKNLANMKAFTATLNDGLAGGSEIYAQPSSSYQFPEIIGNLNSTDFVLYTVTSSAGTNGDITPKGEQYVKSGTAVTFTVRAEDGYMINSLLFDSTPITVLNGFQDGVYTTPDIEKDVTLTVTFEAFELPAVIADDDITDKRTYIPDSYALPISVEETEIDTPYGISFSRVQEYRDCTLTEYGMLFSKTNSSLDMGNHDRKAKGEKKNSYGQFGILFYGEGMDYDTQYYTRAYAVYEDSKGGSIVILGSVFNFTTAEQ